MPRGDNATRVRMEITGFWWSHPGSIVNFVNDERANVLDVGFVSLAACAAGAMRACRDSYDAIRMSIPTWDQSRPTT
jgi:hypothetical protein